MDIVSSRRVKRSFALIISRTYLRVHEFLRKVPRLRDRVGAHQRFADHENLVRVRQLAEFGQRAHQSGIVVSASRGVDEHNVVQHLALAGVGGVYHGVAGNGSCILAVALLEQVDGTDLLATAELAEVAHVYA